MVAISLPSESAQLEVFITDGKESALCCIIDNDRKIRKLISGVSYLCGADINYFLIYT